MQTKMEEMTVETQELQKYNGELERDNASLIEELQTILS